jgi:hypothetical protein
MLCSFLNSANPKNCGSLDFFDFSFYHFYTFLNRRTQKPDTFPKELMLKESTRKTNFLCDEFWSLRSSPVPRSLKKRIHSLTSCESFVQVTKGGGQCIVGGWRLDVSNTLSPDHQSFKNPTKNDQNYIINGPSL